MIAYPWAALYTGIMLILAGGFTLGRHYLFEPVSVRYPKAPFFVRQTIFAFACAMFFVGIRFVLVFFYDDRMTSPPQPDAATQFLATCLFINNAVMFWNIQRQRMSDKDIADVARDTQRLDWVKSIGWGS